MSIYLQFIILGFAAGSAYAVLAASLVSVYRATGIINFAQGAMAMWGAYVYALLIAEGDLVLPVGTLHVGDRVATVPAIVAAVVSAGLLGLVAHLLVFRPLRKAPVLAQVVASVGLMLFLQSLVVLRFGAQAISVDPILPGHTVEVFGAHPPVAALYLVVIAIAGCALIHCYFRFTTLGVATRAGAEDERATRLLGYSPDRLAAIAWTMTGALSGLVVTLATPAIGLNPTTYTLYVVPALAVALVGRLTSISVACVAGIALGAFQALITLVSAKPYWPSWGRFGLQDAVPFVVVIVALFLFGGRIPSRGSLGDVRLPAVTLPALRPTSVLLTMAVGAVLILVTSGNYRFGVATSMILAILALSFVVLTGYLGQISLAQMAFAGSAGFALSKLTVDWHVPFPLSVLLAAAVATALGVLVGIPALRIRGAQLAVVTLAAAVTIEQFVFSNPQFTPQEGNRIGEPKLFGWNLSIREGTNLTRVEFCFMVLVVSTVVILLVGLVMKGDTGRAFLAVRSNERAAASAGINVAFTKLVGFALSAFMAGIAGSLIGYSRGQLSVESFTVFLGMTLLAIAYIGGITSIGGAIVAGIIGPLGIGYVFFNQTLELGKYYGLISAAGLIVSAILNPVGIAGKTQENLRAIRARLRKPSMQQRFEDAAVPSRGVANVR
ncbi:MAG: ABC transporter permease [Ilumatobacteraceae bacterium]